MSTPKVEVEIDLDGARALIDRTLKLVSEEDATALRVLLETLTSMVRLVRKRGTTIARLRRLFGLAKSEKTADVLGRKEAQSEGTKAGEGDAGSAVDGLSGSGRGNDGGADAKKEEGGEKKKGHGRKSSVDYVNARRTYVRHAGLHHGSACPCDCGGKVREQAEPAVTIKIKGREPLAAEAWAMQRLRCDTCGEVFTAEQPEEARGEKYDATAAAMIAVLHYGAGVPFHRLDRVQDQLGTPLPSSTQWEVARDRAEAVVPAYEELMNEAAQADLVHTDDTYACILDLVGERRADLMKEGSLANPERTGLFTTAMVSKVDDTKTIALFATGRAHAGENLDALLEQRAEGLASPIHMSDGLSRNRPRKHEVVSTECLSHGRRGIVDEVDNFPEECRELLEGLAVVFKNEKLTKGMSKEDRRRFHQKNSGFALGQVKKKINTLLRERRVEENSDFGKALLYMQRHWLKMMAFLRVLGAPLTNNLCERVLKMAILYRKNSYFFRSLNGAVVGDIYMTLIHTATLNGENPFHYITELIRNGSSVAACPSNWMPWTYRVTLARLESERAA